MGAIKRKVFPYTKTSLGNFPHKFFPKTFPLSKITTSLAEFCMHASWECSSCVHHHHPDHHVMQLRVRARSGLLTVNKFSLRKQAAGFFHYHPTLPSPRRSRLNSKFRFRCSCQHKFVMKKNWNFPEFAKRLTRWHCAASTRSFRKRIFITKPWKSLFTRIRS